MNIMDDRVNPVNFINNLNEICKDSKVELQNFLGDILYVMCLKKMMVQGTYNEKYQSEMLELSRALYEVYGPQDFGVLRDAHIILEEAYGVEAGLFGEMLSSTRWRNRLLFNEALSRLLACVASAMMRVDDFTPYVEALLKNESLRRPIPSDYISPGIIAELYNIFIDVSDGDVVLDGTVGMGYSLLQCIKNKNVQKVYGVDSRKTAVQIATLCMILEDIDAKIFEENFIELERDIKVDKLMLDIPSYPDYDLKNSVLASGRSVKWLGASNGREVECLFVASAIEHLNENGRLVVIVPTRILFRRSEPLEHFRKKITEDHLLRTVVSLPQARLFNNKSLLVLEKNSQDVLFIDASSKIQATRRHGLEISDEDKELLGDIFKNNKSINEEDIISCVASYDEVNKLNDWSIVKYMNNKETESDGTMDDINRELKECYKELRNLISEATWDID